MNAKSVLPLSLALNIICIVGLLWRTRAPEIESVPVLQLESATVAAEPVPQPRPPTFHWSQVESTNYFVYIAKLRAVGCPEQTIRDIISADLLAAIRGSSATSPAGREASQGIFAAHADRLVNRLLHPQPATHPANAILGTPLLSTAEASDASPDSIAENERIAALLENRRVMRFEAIQRTWLVDSIRSRYGIEALLSWQQQASREGVSFDEFVQRHQVPVPPMTFQR